MLNQIILLALLLVLSGFFSSAETALFSISRAKARHIGKMPGGANRLIHKMRETSHRLLSTILIGNNLVNVGASAMATAIALDLVANNAVGLATGVMTFLILVFGEIFPKSVATRNSVLISRIVIYPIYWLSILFFPIIKFLDFIPMVTGKIKKTPAATEEELMTLVEVIEEEGEIKEEEKELIHNIFEFDDTNASTIMTPRADMYVVAMDQPLDVKAIVESGFSRIPVIDEDIDDIVGVLNIKDLFAEYHATGTIPDVQKIMRPPYFVPGNKKIDTLMQQFKKRKQHIAIIVDEHGGVEGLITLEDVLEEIVGEIADETDKLEQHIVKLRTNEWSVLGKTEIDDVNAKIPMRIPESDQYDTFSGYVLDRIGRIPEEKEEIPIGKFLVTVKEMDGNRIKEYLIQKSK